MDFGDFWVFLKVLGRFRGFWVEFGGFLGTFLGDFGCVFE